MIYAIVACEVGFWVVLLAGLAVRYVWGRRRAGAFLLACVPLVDLALLVGTVLHLRSGAPVVAADGLAAVYLGVTVGFGRSMVTWADGRFAHRFGGLPAPVAPPTAGSAHARHERRMWLRHLVAFAVGATLLLAAAAFVGDRAGPLLAWIPRWGVVLLLDFLWSVSYTVRPRRPRPS